MKRISAKEEKQRIILWGSQTGSPFLLRLFHISPGFYPMLHLVSAAFPIWVPYNQTDQAVQVHLPGPDVRHGRP